MMKTTEKLPLCLISESLCFSIEMLYKIVSCLMYEIIEAVS